MKALYNNGIFGEIDFFKKGFFVPVHHNDNYMDVEDLEVDCIYFYLEDEEPEGL